MVKSAKAFPTLYDPFDLGRSRGLIVHETPGPVIKPRPIHRQIIGLHMSGMSTPEIARTTGRSYNFISTTLKDPQIISIIDRMQDEVDRELSALFPSAVNAVRNVLEKGSDGAKMRAAELVFKTQDKLHENGNKGQETAEDVIARVLGHIKVEGKTVVRVGMEIRTGVETPSNGSSLNGGEETSGITIEQERIVDGIDNSDDR